MFILTFYSLLAPLCLAGFVYYLLVRTLPHLPKHWRRKIMIGYITLHVATWAFMGFTVRLQFNSDVRIMHANALASIPRENERYKLWESNPDPKYFERLQHKVHPKPSYSCWSVAPVPFVLVASEEYQLGPLWGLGMRRVYVFTGFGVKCVFEGRTWIS